MSDLLPANATSQERALSGSTERAAAVPVVVRDVWNPDTCPANMLAWLAWAFSVDEWDSAWTDSQKRGAIKASIAVHQHKGTIGAVKRALDGLAYDAEVQEWFNQAPAGDPYTFRVLLGINQFGADLQALQRLMSVIERTKNLRSHLDRIDLTVTTVAGPFLAAVSFLGSEVTVSYEPLPCIINSTVLIG